VLVSIHMPKTAGLSFRGSLEAHFGDGFRPDYEDYPLAQPADQRRQRARLWGKSARAENFSGIECIHGHFLPLKYLPLAANRPCTFVTWLREPLARLQSHFHYWQRSYDPAAATTSSLHRRVVEEKWSLRRFCLAPELKNVYTEFLWGFPVDRLNFIGITEYYADDLRYFSQEILGNNLQAHTLNRRPDEGASESAGALEPDERLEIQNFHAADCTLYRHALELRRHRLERPPGAPQHHL
jgi:hypothetical protein